MKPSMISRAAMLASLLVFPLAALAQGTAPVSPSPASPAPASPDPAAHPVAPRAAAGQPGGREVYVERRISDLHTRLHITEAQASAWNQFAEVMRNNARNMDQTFEERSRRVNEMSAVANMQSYAQVAEEHAQDVQKLVTAFQGVYDTMSPDQKRTADQLFRNYTERGRQRALGHRG